MEAKEITAKVGNSVIVMGIFTQVELAKSIIKARYGITDKDIESMLCDILELSDYEKWYKKNLKAGSPYTNMIIATDGYHVSRYFDGPKSKEDVKKEVFYTKFIETCKKGFWKDWEVTPKTVMIFGSLDDFKMEVA